MVRILQSQCNRRVHCEETDYISQLITVQISAVSWLTRFLSACHHIYATNHHTQQWYYKICQLNKVWVMFCAFLNISTPIIIQSAISPIEVQHAWKISISFVYIQGLSGRFLKLRSNTNSENGLWVGGVLWVELLFSNSVRNISWLPKYIWLDKHQKKIIKEWMYE